MYKICWETVTDTTIKNCWLKAGILPESNEHDDDDDNRINIQAELERLRELEEVQVLIDNLDFENPFTAEEYVQYNDSEITTDMIPDEEILKTVFPNNDNQEKEVEDLDPLPIITHGEVVKSFDKVILY